MKILACFLILGLSGCLVSTVRTTDKYVDPECNLPTRQGTGNPAYSCQETPKVAPR